MIRERGLGGTPAEEFPPSVDVADAELTDRFHVYAPDAALAREVLRGAVRGTLVGAEVVDQVRVAEGRVVSKQRLQSFDREVLRTHMRVAVTVADAVDSASGR